MDRSRNEMSSDGGALAPVIQLSDAARSRTAPGANPSSETPAAPEVSLPVDRDGEVLRRRYGDGWSELPTNLGRVAAGLERLLEHGPTAVDTNSASPSEVLEGARLVVRVVAEVAPVLQEESEVLGEALGATLDDLPLGQLDRVAGAVLALGNVRGGAAAWAEPAGAHAAHLVLDAHGAAVRSAVELHRDVYERFTERVWMVRESRLRAGRRPLRLIARLLLRADLAAVSRTGKPPGSLRGMGDLLLEARAARQRLADLAPLLERHLGRHHQGPRTDVGAVVESLAAVRELQAALGGRLDVDRLRGLLSADAFATAELVSPALNLRAGLRGWQIEVERLCGGDPWALPVSELGRWADDTGAALPAMTRLLREIAERGHRPVPVRALVDALLLREHADRHDSPPVASAATRSEDASAS